MLIKNLPGVIYIKILSQKQIYRTLIIVIITYG